MLKFNKHWSKAVDSTTDNDPFPPNSGRILWDINAQYVNFLSYTNILCVSLNMQKSIYIGKDQVEAKFE